MINSIKLGAMVCLKNFEGPWRNYVGVIASTYPKDDVDDFDYIVKCHEAPKSYGIKYSEDDTVCCYSFELLLLPTNE